MFSFLQSAGNAKLRKPSKTSSYIYRDELDKKPVPVRPIPSRKVRMCEAKPLLRKDVDKRCSDKKVEKGNMRVKVLMTREEAARLLSKCNDGGVLRFKEVATELLNIPRDRLTLVHSNLSGLECIPE